MDRGANVSTGTSLSDLPLRVQRSKWKNFNVYVLGMERDKKVFQLQPPHHACIFHNGDFQVQNINVGLQQPSSSPPNFDGPPYPTLGGAPIFFHQNERKRCKIDYLKALGQ